MILQAGYNCTPGRMWPAGLEFDTYALWCNSFFSFTILRENFFSLYSSYNFVQSYPEFAQIIVKAILTQMIKIF